MKEESPIRIFVCLEHLLSNFLQKKQLLTFFRATFEQLIRKSQATCGKPSSEVAPPRGLGAGLVLWSIIVNHF